MYEMPQTKKTNYTELTPSTKLKAQETIQILAPTQAVETQKEVVSFCFTT